MFKDEESIKFLKDHEVLSKLNATRKLTEVHAENYDAIFYIGGHGPVLDLANDKNNIELANKVR